MTMSVKEQVVAALQKQFGEIYSAARPIEIHIHGPVHIHTGNTDTIIQEAQGTTDKKTPPG